MGSKEFSEKDSSAMKDQLKAVMGDPSAMKDQLKAVMGDPSEMKDQLKKVMDNMPDSLSNMFGKRAKDLLKDSGRFEAVDEEDAEEVAEEEEDAEEVAEEVAKPASQQSAG